MQHRRITDGLPLSGASPLACCFALECCSTDESRPLSRQLQPGITVRASLSVPRLRPQPAVHACAGYAFRLIKHRSAGGVPSLAGDVLPLRPSSAKRTHVRRGHAAWYRSGRQEAVSPPAAEKPAVGGTEAPQRRPVPRSGGAGYLAAAASVHGPSQLCSACAAACMRALSRACLAGAGVTQRARVPVCERAGVRACRRAGARTHSTYTRPCEQ